MESSTDPNTEETSSSNLSQNASSNVPAVWPPIGIVPTFVLVMGIKAVLGGIGIVFNLDLVFVTFRNKSLHHTCNFLIALSAAGSALYQLGNFPALAVMLNGRNQVTQDVCFLMQAVPLFGKTFSLAMMLAIGLDRLRAVTFIGRRFGGPTKKLRYCLFWSLLASGISLYILIISFFDCSPKRQFSEKVECSFTSYISQGDSTDVVFNITLAMNLASPCVYILLGIILWCRQNESSAVWSRRVFKTIFIMMAIETVGWGSNSLYVWAQHTGNVPRVIGQLVRMSKWSEWLFNKLYSYIVSLAQVANVPAIYFCSTDYRAAFQAHFRSIGIPIGTNSSATAAAAVAPANGPLFVVRSTTKKAANERAQQDATTGAVKSNNGGNERREAA